jgi:hypothetical protein
VGEGLLTGEEVPLEGEPSLLIMVEEIVFLAACLARSVLTKEDTRSSRFPLRLGEAKSSRGPASVWTEEGWEMCVMDDPLAGDSLVEEVGEETVECLGEDESEEALCPESCLSKL